MGRGGETCEETLAVAGGGLDQGRKGGRDTLSPPGGIVPSFKVQIACPLCQVALIDIYHPLTQVTCAWRVGLCRTGRATVNLVSTSSSP